LGVDAHAWIEIVGTALDDHHQRVRVGLGGAGGEGETKEGKEDEEGSANCRSLGDFVSS
jgi:hypothetical protein